ncbi:protein MIZU-KUSSEI 1-like [Rhododendron vialii]|uniref:protein MIZU-KUSSEI 1-like n=1 Tax=Rhododendron vialii TaxID=182163 RepID=UPI0026605343|nr:protein MIZU-KUSSEI 1-like [Rhododendron vialii]
MLPKEKGQPVRPGKPADAADAGGRAGDADQRSATGNERGDGRIALECEKRPERDRTELLQEPLWNMYCKGKKSGYGVKREATEEDLQIMELLRAVSMGAGVLPGKSDVEGPDGELAYMRAHFDFCCVLLFLYL